MMRTQGKDIASRGGAPGAVVTVKFDYCAVSHSIGIVGVIYKMGNYGGARIVTIAGILSTGTKGYRCKRGSKHPSGIDVSM